MRVLLPFEFIMISCSLPISHPIFPTQTYFFKSVFAYTMSPTIVLEKEIIQILLLILIKRIIHNVI